MDNNPELDNKSPIRQRAAFINPNNITLAGSHSSSPDKSPRRRAHKFQITLAVVACMVLGVGLIVSWQTIRTNHASSAAISALTKSSRGLSASATMVSGSSVTVPSTTKPTQRSIDAYTVASDLARYIKIPKLAVYARVMQVGVGDDGAVAAPNNIYDTAWYTGSAKPGQTGATLIDGHISSWTNNGVFYDLKLLSAGDTIQIIKGDGSTLNYTVVTTKVYAENAVDMNAALSPITAGKSGLNLITCAGSVKPGTSEFTDRLVVFAQLKS